MATPAEALYDLARDTVESNTDLTVFASRMLQRGLSLDTVSEIKYYGNMTALHWACTKRDLGSVLLLIRAGADVNVRGDVEYDEKQSHSEQIGVPPLSIVAMRGYTELVQPLIGAKADLNVCPTSPPPGELGFTPLQYALEQSHFDVAALLLRAGADPNAGEPTESALRYAVGASAPDELIFELVCRGANVEATNEYGGSITKRAFNARSAAAAVAVGCPDDPWAVGTEPEAVAEYETLKKELAVSFARFSDKFTLTQS